MNTLAGENWKRKTQLTASYLCSEVRIVEMPINVENSSFRLLPQEVSLLVIV